MKGIGLYQHGDVLPPEFYEECPDCEGDGYTIRSCCDDNLKGSDTFMCPTCHEHCGDERETCLSCAGTGDPRGRKEAIDSYDPDIEKDEK